jgi:hypothetical protein
MMNKALKMAGFAACLVAVLAMCAKTFSGKHPCSMCLKIRKGMQEDKQREEKLPWIKTEKMPEPLWELRCVTVPAAPTVARCERPFVPVLHTDFIDSPPSPPPRPGFRVL